MYALEAELSELRATVDSFTKEREEFLLHLNAPKSGMDEKQLQEEVYDLRQEVERLRASEADLIERLKEGSSKKAKGKRDSAVALATVKEMEMKEHETQLQSEVQRLRGCERDLQLTKHEAAVAELMLVAFYQVAKPQHMEGTHAVGGNATRSASLVLDRLGDWNCFVEPDPAFFAKIVETLNAISHIHNGCTVLSFYWLATMWDITQTVCRKLSDLPHIQKLTATERTYVTRPEGAGGVLRPGEDDPHARFVLSLRAALFSHYGACVQAAVASLASVGAAQAMFEPDQAPQQPAAIVKKGQKPTRGKAESAANVHRPVMPDVITALLAIRRSAAEAKLHESLQLQLFAQLMQWLNAHSVNTLVSRPELCTCTTGIQLKMSLSALEDFLCKPEAAAIFGARRYLEHTKQASNLLVMDKAVLLDPSNLESVFGELNIAQICCIVRSFKTDSMMPQVKNLPAVLTELAKYEAKAKTQALQLDPLTHVVPKV
eukprot:TRINITY_DN2486_c0_g1_i2.p1 TRINITY_DN2486_c0_g1~~TRINITY_DN2486_c0_g1_i2.p1  ORF type:complete len:489 (-),score=145.56 TRINITY_DN2486_c0_g1_i2:58-1524(-)